MALSLNVSTPIGTAKQPNCKRFRGRRTAPTLCFALSFVLVMNYLSRYRSSDFVGIGRSSSSNNVRSTTKFFCSGWTFSSHPHRRLQRKLNFGSPLETTAGGIGLRRAASTSASTKLFMVKAKATTKYEVGDFVHIISRGNDELSPITITTKTIEKQETTVGEVVAIRGSGWYSVRLLQCGDNDNDNYEIIKCRRTQLQRLAYGINDGQVLSNQNKATFSDSSSTGNIDSKTNLSPSSSPSPRTDNSTFSIKAFKDPEFTIDLPLTIYDLDAEISRLKRGTIGNDDMPSSHPRIEERVLQQAAHHATYEKWVVFSDLHCSPSTLDTCLEVLEIVHNTALQQTEKCGVLFLGDFWHYRGTLRVDCLNAVLGALRSWKVPMVMIPGNHDQVTLGGDNHGLTPLENAYRVGGVEGPLILSFPTVFRNALFVPHVRDHDTMTAIVGSREAHQASALFLHTEVKGAIMNDMIISTKGISPSVFPNQKHIYSGHFHKPHFIKTPSTSSSTIEYMGSPYQITLAEAHQEKKLVVLDANWKCQKRVPLCVGRRHFKISTLEELQHLTVDEETVPSADGVSANLANNSIPVKKGDRIVISLPKNHQQQRKLVDSSDEGALWKSRVQSLREQGLMVEVREANEKRDHQKLPSSSCSASIPGFEELSPESVWRAYLKDAIIRDSIHEEDRESMLEAGLGILKELEESSSSGAIQSSETQKDLRLTSMSVVGFGPFEDTIQYPLDNRGLVLLRGSNSDCGPDSNGTGKSSLAMAALWALTGSLDARPASDLKVADVVNDNSKVAKVTLKGFINNSPFVISRSKTASKGDLVFHVNDVDLTTQSPKETQAVVEEKLGVDAHILTRVAFYGQHGMNDLLEATDSKLKEELSVVVPLDLWQQATSVARAKSRQAKKRADEMEGMIRLRKADIDTLSNRAARAKESSDFKRKGLLEAEEKLNRELMRIQDLLDRTSNSEAEEIQAQLEDISLEIGTLNDLYDSTMKEKDSHLKPLDDELTEARGIVASMTRENTAFEMDVRASKVSLDSARMRINQIKEKWSLDVSLEIPSVLKPPEICPTCKQPLHSETGGEVSDETINNAQEAMESEINEAQEILRSAEGTYKDASIKSSESMEALRTQENLFRDLQSNHQHASSKWSTKLNDLQEQWRVKRHLQNSLTSQISMVVKESQLVAEREAAKGYFNTQKLNLAHAEEVYRNLENELETAVEFLQQLRSKKEKAEYNQSLLSGVGERFGQRGVQTFLLQNTVDALQRTAQIYLSYLSDDSQRIELSLDAGDKILRSAFVRGADGAFRQRPLSTLSGGQWRRCSLALSFAFADRVASKGRLRSSLLVLDEPLTHLDRSGRAKFGELVRTMLGSGKADDVGLPTMSPAFMINTAIVILQDLSAEEIEEAFDGIDTVVRKDGRSSLALDDMSSALA